MSEAVRLDHVALAVRDLQAALRVFETLGFRCARVEEVPWEEVRVAFLSAGEVALELVEPTSEHGAVGRFLAARGEGVHHVALRVPDLRQSMERAAAAGLAVVPPAPRSGAQGSQVAFLHPRTTHGVLIELVQRADTL
ncbi:MAG: methylmalonyl-CoA epimerase [Firmicutes bacterium]|nr:methylmalonyl-CoA epimerase [Bacillota bacterium]